MCASPGSRSRSASSFARWPSEETRSELPRRRLPGRFLANRSASPKCSRSLRFRTTTAPRGPLSPTSGGLCSTSTCLELRVRLAPCAAPHLHLARACDWLDGERRPQPQPRSRRQRACSSYEAVWMAGPNGRGVCGPAPSTRRRRSQKWILGSFSAPFSPPKKSGVPRGCRRTVAASGSAGQLPPSRTSCRPQRGLTCWLRRATGTSSHQEQSPEQRRRA